MSGLLADPDLLLAFENQFDPAHPAASPLHVLGHGKFSTVFQIDGLDDVALKRLPPFPTAAMRALYARSLNAYHMLLRDAVGLNVVDQRCIPITNAAGEHVLYIAQERLPSESIGDYVLARCSDEQAAELFSAVVRNVLRVWYRNEIEKELDMPGSLTGLDAQLSNWAVAFDEGHVADVFYLDTSTPFFRRLGKDRLEPELFLSSVPSPLAGLVRQHFIGDVLERYYDLRLVLLDFLADLYDIGEEERLPLALDLVNYFLAHEAADLYVDPIAREEVDRYAREDARFWKRFLALSRLKRFTSTRLLRRRYHFTLPQ